MAPVVSRAAMSRSSCEDGSGGGELEEEEGQRKKKGAGVNEKKLPRAPIYTRG
jgi:hypothetical protein